MAGLDPDNATFELTESRDGETVVIAVSGELDLAVAGQLEERLTALRGEGARTRLNLAGLTFMDSTGYACIARSVRDARDQGWELSIDRELQSQVRMLLEVTDGESLLWPS